jgi:simple sugar transport system ATP-binding protein
MIRNPSGRGDEVGVATVAVATAVNIWKSFGASAALRGVSLDVIPGEVHGVVGRNGAGKSTLVGVLTGLFRPAKGTVEFGGKPAPSLSDRAAWQRNVACVYQRSMVVPTLTVAENLFLNRPMGVDHGIVRWGEVRERAHGVLRDWGFDLDVDRVAGTLSVEERQVVEIARALSIGARFLILDEPTASLERAPIERLFGRIRDLRASGVGILFISHHLEEVFEICDRVTVLRDGERVLEGSASEVSPERVIEAMVGRPANHATASVAPTDDQKNGIRLEVTRLTCVAPTGRVDDVSFTVRTGECVGLVGLRGSGSTTIAEAIVGLVRPAAGEVRLDGNLVPAGRVDLAVQRGIAYVPDDRHARGFVSPMSVEDNLTLAVLPRLSRYGVVSGRARRYVASGEVEALDIIASGLDQPVGQLSGGNQQKVVVGRSLAQQPTLLVAVTPTVGVDVASKEALLEAISTARQRGMSVLLVSDDMDDLRICTRLLVMVRGRLADEFKQVPWDEHVVIAAVEGLETTQGAVHE